MSTKIYKMEDGSEVHEVPSRASSRAFTIPLAFVLESPAWRVIGGEKSQAYAFALELKRQWAEEVKLDFSARMEAKP